MRRSPIALILYNWRDQWPMRRWERERLFAWRGRFPGRTVFFNIGFPFEADGLGALDPDVIVYDATALALRDRTSGWERLMRAVEALDPADAPRVAMPLDEFRGVERLRSFLADARIGLLLTAADPKAAAVLYPGAACEVRRILTAYVDPRLADVGRRAPRPGIRRLGLSYRLWGAETGLGLPGDLKRRIGVEAAAWAQARGVRADIRVDGSGALAGEGWIRFLSATRATVGAEGGSSVMDPGACEPPGAPADFDLRALSPRHLEAAATRTYQVLVEGDYSGVLRSGLHYAPVRPDLGDLHEALERSLDLAEVEATTARAYEELIASGDYGWERLIAPLSMELLA